MTVAGANGAPRWELYKLLSEPVRLRLLALLREEELAVSELAELVNESQPNVSRHASTLRQAGLIVMRRQGTWTFLRLDPRNMEDLVIADALATGRALCERDGTLARIAELVHARDEVTREFFARSRDRAGEAFGPPPELAAYLRAMALLIPQRGMAVDAGTGEGRLLEVLAPVFDHVLAVDRSEAQLTLCRERMAVRGFTNVSVIAGEIDGSDVRSAVSARGGADLVMASRVLHHAPRPGEMVRRLASLVKFGGAVIVLDYAPHDDEMLREQQADLWLGFEPDDLANYAREAGLVVQGVVEIPTTFRGTGPDRYVGWQALVATATFQQSHTGVRIT